MRKIFYMLMLCVLPFLSGNAQDFDVYPKLNNDHFDMPAVQAEMRIDEFRLLSRDIRMMDMGYAIFVPGYVHFKARDFAVGYAILGSRLLGYAGLYYNYKSMKNTAENFSEIFSGEFQYKDDIAVFTGSMLLIGGSYLFDWIHGKYRLEKKQETIRYRYSMKMQMAGKQGDNVSYVPSLSVQMNF